MQSEKRPYRWTTILSVAVVAILLVVAAFFATYSWQHRQVNDLNDKISSLNRQITNQNDQLSALKGQTTQSCSTTPAETNPNASCQVGKYTSLKGVAIIVYSPLKNTTVASPLAVIGEVPGNWSSEAQFPVELKDSAGAVIAQTTGHVLGEWQTSELVPFSAQLTYSGKHSGTGTLVLERDNPSGMATQSDSLQIPISF